MLMLYISSVFFTCLDILFIVCLHDNEQNNRLVHVKGDWPTEPTDCTAQRTFKCVSIDHHQGSLPLYYVLEFTIMLIMLQYNGVLMYNTLIQPKSPQCFVLFLVVLLLMCDQDRTRLVRNLYKSTSGVRLDSWRTACPKKNCFVLYCTFFVCIMFVPVFITFLSCDTLTGLNSAIFMVSLCLLLLPM